MVIFSMNIYIIGVLSLKFKFIFIVFHIMVLILLAAVSAVLFFSFGAETALQYWQSSWLPLVIVIVVIAVLDLFYAVNYRLLVFLEREDWPAVAQYLEPRIGKHGRYSHTQVRLLANTYLVLSDTASVIALENKLGKEKPELVEQYALIFGTARILNRNITGAVRFFSERCTAASSAHRKPPEQTWIQWFYSFSLMLDHQFALAAEQFTVVLRQSPDVLPVGLAAFFLVDVLAKVLPEQSDRLNGAAAESRDRVRTILPTASNWHKEFTKQQNTIYIAILSRYAHDAENWLYAPVTG
jgi:hypothetical protein